MSIGAHMSIAGGLDQALRRGFELGCETVQIFTGNRNRWQVPPLTEAEIKGFRRAAKKYRIEPLMAHGSYLINLASPDHRIFDKSIAALQDELERASILGIQYLIIHPGYHGGSGQKAGISRIVQGIDLSWAEARGRHPSILLETTAGQGTSLGCRLEQLAEIRNRSRYPERLGFCFDTCHVFASGYDIRRPSSYERTMERLIALLGIENLKAFHLNDSQRDLGSRVDRHQHIGRGLLGRQPFHLLLHDDRLRHLPMVLETPKGLEGGKELDEINLETLRDLRRGT